MKYLLSLYMLFFSVLSFANEQEDLMTKEMNNKLENIKSFPPTEYTTSIQEIRKDLDKFIDYKKGICSGDYSTVVLNEEIQEEKVVKLTRAERDLCFRELKSFQTTYINNQYEAKKKYLDYLHIERLKKLAEIRDENLRLLKATYDKQLTPKKKRRRRR